LSSFDHRSKWVENFLTWTKIILVINTMGKLLIDYSKNTAPLQPPSSSSSNGNVSGLNRGLIDEERLGMSLRFQARIMTAPSPVLRHSLESKLEFMGVEKRPKNNPSAIYPLLQTSTLSSLSAALSSFRSPEKKESNTNKQSSSNVATSEGQFYEYPTPSKITFRLPRHHRFSKSCLELSNMNDLFLDRSSHTTKTAAPASMKSHDSKRQCRQHRQQDDTASTCTGQHPISVCTAPVAATAASVVRMTRTSPSEKFAKMATAERDDSPNEWSEEENQSKSFLPTCLAQQQGVAPSVPHKTKKKMKKQNVSLGDWLGKQNEGESMTDRLLLQGGVGQEEDSGSRASQSHTSMHSKRSLSSRSSFRRTLPRQSSSWDGSTSRLSLTSSLSQMSLSQMSQRSMSRSYPIGRRGKRLLPVRTNSFDDSSSLHSNATSSTRRGGRRPTRMERHDRKNNEGYDPLSMGELSQITSMKSSSRRRTLDRTKSSDGISSSFRSMKADSSFAFMAGSRIRVRTLGDGAKKEASGGMKRISTSRRSMRSGPKETNESNNNDIDDDSNAKTVKSTILVPQPVSTTTTSCDCSNEVV